MPRTFFYRAVPRVNPGIPKISFSLFGQWKQTMDLLSSIGPKVKKASIAAQLKVGKEIAKKVKAHIRNQDLGWQDLSEEYARRKADAGLHSETLMAYKTYYENINVWESGNKKLINIGVKRGIYTREVSGKRSKLDVATIAGINEFASGNRVPRRPLWNPTIVEMGGAKGIKKMYINSLIWHLRASGVNVRKLNGFGLIVNDKKVTL